MQQEEDLSTALVPVTSMVLWVPPSPRRERSPSSGADAEPASGFAVVPWRPQCSFYVPSTVQAPVANLKVEPERPATPSKAAGAEDGGLKELPAVHEELTFKLVKSLNQLLQTYPEATEHRFDDSLHMRLLLFGAPFARAQVEDLPVSLSNYSVVSRRGIYLDYRAMGLWFVNAMVRLPPHLDSQSDVAYGQSRVDECSAPLLSRSLQRAIGCQNQRGALPGLWNLLCGDPSLQWEKAQEAGPVGAARAATRRRAPGQ
jgi:hypothetical protein